MNKIIFKITTKISDKLNDLCLWIVDDGRKYNQYKTIFYIIDNLATKVYNFGYNNFA